MSKIQYEPTPSVWYIREYRQQLLKWEGYVNQQKLARGAAHNAYVREFWSNVKA